MTGLSWGLLQGQEHILYCSSLRSFFFTPSFTYRHGQFAALMECSGAVECHELAGVLSCSWCFVAALCVQVVPPGCGGGVHSRACCCTGEHINTPTVATHSISTCERCDVSSRVACFADVPACMRTLLMLVAVCHTDCPVAPGSLSLQCAACCLVITRR
jgi:hypothetical protein